MLPGHYFCTQNLNYEEKYGIVFVTFGGLKENTLKPFRTRINFQVPFFGVSSFQISVITTTTVYILCKMSFSEVLEDIAGFYC